MGERVLQMKCGGRVEKFGYCQRMTCSAKFVATLVCLVQVSRYVLFCEKETSASHRLQVCGFSVAVVPTVPVLAR